MKKLILPLVATLVGVSVGTGAGIYFAPAGETVKCEDGTCGEENFAKSLTKKGDDTVEPEYVRMKNQFVVPVVHDEKVKSLVVLSLSLETDPGATDVIYEREPKLRDSFLQVLFDHAHIGGFDGQFTQTGQMSILRVALLEAAQRDIGTEVRDILITDIIRQEL